MILRSSKTPLWFLVLVVMLRPMPAMAQTAAAGADAGRAQGRASGPAQVPTEVRAATEFLFVANPDLLQRPIAMTANPTGGRVIVTVRDGTPSAGRAPTLLGAVFEFLATGELKSYVASGELLEQARNEAVRQSLRAHPGLTPLQLLSAVRSIETPAAPATTAGAIDPARWSRFVGTNPQVGAAKGAVTARPGSVDSPDVVRDLQATARDGTAAAYRLQYEPFGGRLVAVVRQ